MNELFIINDFLDSNDFNELTQLLKNLSFKNDFRMNSRKTICLNYKIIKNYII